MNTSMKTNDKRATDPLDHLIFEEGLRMKSVWFNQELDMIVVLLNNKKLIQRPLSNFPRLSEATMEQLQNYENDGIGIHWPELDEDLSLRGFLKYELAQFADKVA